MINLGITCQRLRFLVLNFFVFTLLGCDPQITQSDMTETAASDFTLAHNQRFVDNLDLGHQQDFDDATQGLVAYAPNDELVSDLGFTLWDP
ncbi:MAG: alkyl sulfatase BDS1-like metallo-beta-lactamase superfamily hydrolase, partial [Porticoccaceae bacterium]